MRSLEVLLQFSLPGTLPEKLHSLESLHLWVFTWIFQGCFDYQTKCPSFLSMQIAGMLKRQNKLLSSYSSYDFSVLNNSNVDRQGKGTSTSFSCSKSGPKVKDWKGVCHLLSILSKTDRKQESNCFCLRHCASCIFLLVYLSRDG